MWRGLANTRARARRVFNNRLPTSHFFLFWKQVCPGQPPISFNGSSAVCGVRCSCRACVSMTERHAPHAKLNRGSRATAPRDATAAQLSPRLHPPTWPLTSILLFSLFSFLFSPYYGCKCYHIFSLFNCSLFYVLLCVEFLLTTFFNKKYSKEVY